MHRAYEKVGLRAGFKNEKRQRWAFAAASVFAFALCTGLAGCAEDPSYPGLSRISDLGTILTPEERQKTVDDLQKNANAGKTAPKQTAANLY